MTWRDKLQKAALGKAGFLVDSSDGQLGRNVQVHEYPLRDKPYVEDLGRKARRFTLEAYVIGADYMSARDALIAQLETPGSKTLMHPYLGELKVTVVEAQGPRESTREGGMARFSITVVESGEHVFPTSAADTQKKVDKNSDDTLEKVKVTAEWKWNVAAQPSFVADSAVNRLRKFSGDLQTLVARITTLPQKMAGYIAAAKELSDTAAALVLTPKTMIERISNLIRELTNIAAAPAHALQVVQAMVDYGQDFAVVPTGTPSRQQEADNQQALVQLVQVSAICTAAQLASTLEYASADDALAMRDELIAAIDDQGERLDDDTLYYALVDLRTAVVADLEQRAAQLAQLTQVQLRETTAAVVLAYELYEDALRDAEVIARNAVRDGNFLPSGRALEVLSHV